jgi:hypothetical protein
VKSRSGLRVVCGLGAAAIVAAMAWLTVDLLAMERARETARVETERQDAMRLALWRMDSWTRNRPRASWTCPTPAAGSRPRPSG